MIRKKDLAANRLELPGMKTKAALSDFIRVRKKEMVN